MDGTHRVLVIDAEKCTGCGLCEMACSLQHEGQCSAALSRIKVLRREELGLSLPVVCMQCVDALCVAVCPVAAIRRDPASGALLVHSDLCIGCRLCVPACHLGAVSISEHAADGKVLKCDLCAGDPRCVSFCGTGALSWLPSSKLGDVQRRKGFARYQRIIAPWDIGL